MNKKILNKHKNKNSPLEIGALYEQELQVLNEDLRRQATLSMFYKLQPNNHITVEDFFAGIKQHKDVWSVVSNMGIIDFSNALANGNKPDSQLESKSKKRTRLSELQKRSIKEFVLQTITVAPNGLNRNEIAKNIDLEKIISLRVNPAELSSKLRQPLAELVKEKKIITVGAKRLMKYTTSDRAKNRS